MNFIVADPKGENWSFAKKVYDKIKTKTNNFRLNEVSIERFRYGEIKPKIKKNIRNGNCFFIHDSNKKPADWFLELCLINHTMRKSSAEKIIDVMPYMDFSRQDRKDESRVPISARVVADVVCLYADSVITIDPHNRAIEGFYSIPFNGLYSFPVTVKHIKRRYPKMLENLVIMSTDTGGAAGAKDYARKFGIDEVAISYKTRPKSGEVGTIKILGEVAEKNVLIVDDMIDSGGTLAKAAQEAKKKGAKKLYAYSTLGLFTEGMEIVTPYFERVFVGDIIKLEKPHNKIEVISFTDLFADAIYRTSKGQSLS